MKPRLLLLLLIISAPSNPSPVSYILDKTTFNPIRIISSGIVATEKVIITTKYPISDYSLDELCVIAAPDLYKLTPYQLQRMCTPLKNRHFTSSGLALIELTQDLLFVYGVNAAEIPYIDSLDKTNSTSDCKMMVNSGKNDHITSQKFVDANASYPDDNPFIEVTLKEGRELCTKDNGLPLYCKDAVIGIFVFNLNVTECSSETGVKAMKLIGEEANELLWKFIPGPL